MVKTYLLPNGAAAVGDTRTEHGVVAGRHPVPSWREHLPLFPWEGQTRALEQYETAPEEQVVEATTNRLASPHLQA